MSDDLLAQFLIEGREQAAAAADGLEALRRAPDDAAALENCFRAVHTLKGSTGLFDLAPMAGLLHQAEELLSDFRQRSASPEDLNLLVATIDQVDGWLDALEATGRLPNDAADDAAALLRSSSAASGGRSTVVRPPGEAAPQFPGLVGVALRYIPHADAFFAGDDPLALVAQVPNLLAVRVRPREPFSDLALYDPFRCNLVIEAVSAAQPAQVAEPFRFVSDQVTFYETAHSPEATARGPRLLRVEADRLDLVADFADEVVIASAGLSDLALAAEALPGGESLARALRERQAAQDRLATGLHAAVARLRLVPLAPLFARFPRLVRELARDLGKLIDFEAHAGDVALDKAISDSLFEPLLHVLRNAADHGAEVPETRRVAGKPERARLTLSASVEGERVIIEVRDDGPGLDPSALRRLAVKRGLITPASAQALDDQGALDLVFLPGFSSRDTVSTVSGRGVGMDAVRSAVARLGGAVTISNLLGGGAIVRMDLPFAVKLSRLLVVSCGGERYGLDLAAIHEVTQVSPEQVSPIKTGFGFAWRDQAIPLLALAGKAGLGGDGPASGGRVVVTRTPRGPVGLVVDPALYRLEAAVRPPPALLATSPAVTGVTRLPDGGVLLVLSPAEISRWA